MALTRVCRAAALLLLASTATASLAAPRARLVSNLRAAPQALSGLAARRAAPLRRRRSDAAAPRLVDAAAQKQAAAPAGSQLAFWEAMFAGALSRGVAQLCTHPMNVAKTMLQVRGYRSPTRRTPTPTTAARAAMC